MGQAIISKRDLQIRTSSQQSPKLPEGLSETEIGDFTPILILWITQSSQTEHGKIKQKQNKTNKQ